LIAEIQVSWIGWASLVVKSFLDKSDVILMKREVFHAQMGNGYRFEKMYRMLGLLHLL
jgi:hypothetical protein